MIIPKEDFMEDTVMIIIAALLAVSEALALIPSLKSNGIFDLIKNSLKILSGKK